MKKIFKIVFLLLVMTGVASWIFSQSSWGQRTLKNCAEKTLSKGLEAKVTIGSIDLLFPFFIKIHDIDIAKKNSTLSINSFSCMPFWLDLPFKRVTLISAAARGIEIGGDHPEEFLESSTTPSYSLSVLSLRLRSLHVAHEKIPGKSFDGSLKGRVYISSSMDIVKIHATITRSLPTAWPKKIKVRIVKHDDLYHCSGSLFLNGVMTSFSPFGPNDRFRWNFFVKKEADVFQELKGSWKIDCPTTELPLINNFVVNRMLRAEGSLKYTPQKELSLSCDDINLSMVFGKNVRIQNDIEGAGTTLMQYGEPLTFRSKMTLEAVSLDETSASIRFLSPSFSCNSYHGSIQGALSFSVKDGAIILSYKADGNLLSEGIEVPIQLLGDLGLDSTSSSMSADLLVAPFHLSSKVEKSLTRTSTWSTFRCQDLSVLQKFLPISISGSGDVSFSSTQSDAENLMNISSHFANASLGSFSCTSADVSLSSQNFLSRIDTTVDISSGKVGSLTLDKAQASYSINPKTLDLILSDLRIIGKAAALPFDLSGSGEGKIDSIQSYLTLTNLNGTLLDEKFRLERPIRLECIDIEELCSQALFSCRIGDQGSLDGHWIHPSPSRSTLELTWRDIPFPIMAALTGIGTARGVMSGECHYQTTPRDAVGSFQMQANVSRCGALGGPQGALEIKTKISLAHYQLTGDFSVVGTGVLEPIECSFTLPVKRRPKTPLFELFTTSPLRASLRGKAQVSKLFYYWMPEEIGCEAILSLKTKFSGSLDDIRVHGPVTLSEGRMELLATGQVLENIEMQGEMHKRILTINSIKASDTGEGSLTGTGLMNFFEEGIFSWKLFLTCKNLEVVNLPYAKAIADGTIQLDGTSDSLLISGNGIAKKAFIDVAARFPSNIPELSVTFCGEKKAEKPPFLVSFDLYLEAPSGGEIRGRGLRTDWKGHAHLSGPVTKLDLSGIVECTKGTFTLAGKELTISHGTISVAGNLFRDSRLNVLANVSLPTISVQVGLKGSLKEPKFFIHSSPILPEKEVLSLLLFNKEYSDISPLESLQLANAAMSLQQSSGPFDLIDRVKTTLGIDLIDIGSSQITPGQPAPWSTLGADSEEAEGPIESPQNNVTLKVGKYISSGVAVTVSKDVTAGVNRVGLEASLSQHVTAEAEIGDDAGGIASLKWKKDY